MRLALAALLAFAFSASADAQARFVNACIASAAAEEDTPFDPDRVCGCSASRSMTAGADPRDLDRLIDYIDAEGDLAAGSMPAALQSVAGTVSRAMVDCALADVGGSDVPAELDGMRRAYAESFDPDVPAVIGTPSASQPPAAASTPAAASAPAAPRPPAGLRTGNGVGPVRTSAPSPGAAIRVIG